MSSVEPIEPIEPIEHPVDMHPNEKKTTIYQVAREYEGIAEASWVGAVVKGLTQGASQCGLKTVVVLPYYGFLVARLRNIEKIGQASIMLLDSEEKVTMWRYHTPSDTEFFLLENRYFSDKQSVYVYTHEREYNLGEEHTDREEMDMVLQKGALELAKMIGAPDIFHLHDGHTAWLPVLACEDEQYKDFFIKTKFVLTLHNVTAGEHQEIAGLHKAKALTELPLAILKKGIIDGDTVDPIILAGHYSSLTTISPEFAQEILSKTNGMLFGYLGHYLEEHHIPLTGLYSGVDFDALDPRRSTQEFPLFFNPGDAKTREKAMYRDYVVMLSQEAMQAIPRHGYLDANEGMCLVCLCSRIVFEKGIEYACEALKPLMEENKNLYVAVMGRGDLTLEYKLIAMSKHPQFFGRFVYWQGYSKKLQRILLSGGHFVLAPSVYEPFGFIDLYGQIYGCLPIVHATGGFKKVRNGVTGFSFDTLNSQELARCLDNAIKLYRENPAEIYRMRNQAFESVQTEYDWPVIFQKEYLPFYKKFLHDTEES